MGGVGVVFVSGEERETTDSKTTPAASSLFSVCDLPFAVTPLRRALFPCDQSDRLPDKDPGSKFTSHKFSKQQLSTGMQSLRVYWALSFPPSGMPILKTKTMSAKLGH